MPEISRFFGIIIAMYWREHGPPHFHVRYGDHKATISIDTLELLEGSLPRRALALIVEWAILHRGELRENWERATDKLELKSIEPLE